MTSKEFGKIVGAIVSMTPAEQEILIRLLNCKSEKQWGALEFLEDLIYNSSDMGAATAALRGKNENRS